MLTWFWIYVCGCCFIFISVFPVLAECLAHSRCSRNAYWNVIVVSVQQESSAVILVFLLPSDWMMMCLKATFMTWKSVSSSTASFNSAHLGQGSGLEKQTRPFHISLHFVHVSQLQNIGPWPTFIWQFPIWMLNRQRWCSIITVLEMIGNKLALQL